MRWVMLAARIEEKIHPCKLRLMGKTGKTENISEGYSVIGGHVKWILKKWDRRLWTGFISLRISTKSKFS
jgi:hypothetical protein